MSALEEYVMLGPHRIRPYRGRPDITRRQFGLDLRAMREEKGMSTYTVAQESGVDHTLIGRYERHERFPNEETISRLADAMRLTLDERARLYVSAGFLPVSPSVRKACGEVLLREAS